MNTHLDMKTENGDVVNVYADLKKSGVRIMIILGCEKNSSASENRERIFFFRQSLVQSKAVVISCATVVSRFRCLCRSHFTD